MIHQIQVIGVTFYYSEVLIFYTSDISTYKTLRYLYKFTLLFLLQKWVI